MFNWELQSAAKMVGGGAELNQNEEGELKVFLARLSRVGDRNLEPDEIRETAAYQDLPDHIRPIVDLYLDSVENSEEKEQKILELTRTVRRTRELMPSASPDMKDFVDSDISNRFARWG